MTNSLDVGDVRVGHVTEDPESSGFVQSGTLTFDSERGARLAVPYLWESANDPEPRQFAKAISWFDIDSNHLPRTLLFVDERGWITLSDIRNDGQSIGTHPIGNLRAGAVIFNRPRAVRDEYLVNELVSTIDGLEEFARFQPVKHEIERPADRQMLVNITADASEVVEWDLGGFHYAIQSNFSWSAQQGRAFQVADSEPFIGTSRSGGATLQDHLSAQWPLRALLVLLHGERLAWRTHKLRDDEFPLWMLDGSDMGANPVQVHFAGTIQERSFPRPSESALAFPVLHLANLGAEGMRKWVELYADEAFRHAVEPAVEVINGASKFLEPQLMMLAISLDRFGHFRFGDKRRRSMAENIERCLTDANLDWAETIGSRQGISKAIANVNNDLKHPDRQNYPRSDELVATVRLAEIIARAQVFDLLSADPKWLDSFVGHNSARNAIHNFTERSIRVDDDGFFIHD
jgi:hypothetical protein